MPPSEKITGTVSTASGTAHQATREGYTGCEKCQCGGGPPVSSIDGPVRGQGSAGADEALVGCADVIRGYPVPGTATVGLFLIVESWQRRGIGSQAFRLVEESARKWGRCDRIRIGVVRSNEQVMRFWLRHGFRPTGETRPWREGPAKSEIVYLEKRVPDPATNR